MLKTFKLSNGIQVASYNLPSLRSFHLRLSAKGGAIVENKLNNGVAHLMEHMLVQGTPTLPNVEQFSSFMESLAGSYSAYTESLLIGFNITIPTTRLEDALKISSEVFFEPLFVEDAIDRERNVILEELRQKMDSHWYKIGKFFYQTRFKKNHPLTYDVGGDIEVIKKLSREDLVKFWKELFVPQNTFLLVSGKFEEGQLKNLLEKYFARFASGKKSPRYPSLGTVDFSGRDVFIRFDENLKANYIDLSFPAVSLSDPLILRIKQNLALTILGGLRNSRLFKLLRYQRGLVYNVDSGSSIYPGLGYAYIDCQASPQHLDEVVDLTTLELDNFVRLGPTEEELNLVKNYLSNRWEMSFDHPSAIAGWIENDLLWNDKIRVPEEYIEMIEDIKVGDIVDLMQNHWDFSKLNLTIQGPIQNTKENRDKFSGVLEKLK